jgi:hypothetical protein
MGSKISTDPAIFFVNFDTGNEASDIDDYLNYALDHSSNYVEIRDKFNILVDEVNALGGSGALVNFDLVGTDSAGTPGGVRTTGLVGAHSYAVTINGGDASFLDVAAGVAIINGRQRVQSVSPVSLDGAAATPIVGVNYVALDVNGQASIQTGAGAKSLDVASAVWDAGGFFTSVTRFESSGDQVSGDQFLATIMPDGDAHREFLFRPNIGSSWQDKNYYRPVDRVLAIERILAGITTDGDGHAIGPLALDAAWLAAGVVKHERGGLEFDASGVVDGDFIVGTGTGTMGLESGATVRTTIGLGLTDTPSFTRLGLGIFASGTASEMLLLSRAGDAEVILIDTGGARVELTAAGTGRLATNSAHDLELYRGGVAAGDMRMALDGDGGLLQTAGSDTVFDWENNSGTPQLSFFGVAAVARPAAYSPSNVTPDRAYDADSTTLDEVADVLGTLISDLQGLGLVS